METWQIGVVVTLCIMVMLLFVMRAKRAKKK
jgi:hypothetical protein